ncbi:MAG: 4-hydroxy-3-methylbut-2-enyl diphosphate reductase, partial [Planctomycetota bacterium]
SRQEQDGLRERCEDVLDATCPHVRRVQDIVAKYAKQGYTCVVVGDAGHAEVDGVLSFAGPGGHVVSGPDEVDGLPHADKVVVVAQTTQDEDLFRRTLARIRERFGECLAFETICRSTERRQAEVRGLAQEVDAMIVVGGFNSANTRRLAEISSAAGTRTFHVETERQIDVDEVLRCEKVGLTAGASTPNWMIRRVVRHLEDEHRRRTQPGRYWCRTVLRCLVNANVYAAGAAGALTFACSRLLSRPPRLLGLCIVVSFFFVLGQHLLNQYGRRESLYLAEPDRAGFFKANEKTLLLLGSCASGPGVSNSSPAPRSCS